MWQPLDGKPAGFAWGGVAMVLVAIGERAAVGMFEHQALRAAGGRIETNRREACDQPI